MAYNSDDDLSDSELLERLGGGSKPHSASNSLSGSNTTAPTAEPQVTSTGRPRRAKPNSRFQDYEV